MGVAREAGAVSEPSPTGIGRLLTFIAALRLDGLAASFPDPERPLTRRDFHCSTFSQVAWSGATGRRHRHPRQSLYAPEESASVAKLISRSRGQRAGCTCRLTALILIQSIWPSPNSKPICARRAHARNDLQLALAQSLKTIQPHPLPGTSFVIPNTGQTKSKML